MTILLAILIVLLVFRSNEVAYVKAESDNRTYLIRRGTKPQKFLTESANTLAEINKRVSVLITHLQTKYSNDPNKNYWITMLDKNYKPDILSEAAIDNRYTTFTVDKSTMHVCLRTRDKNEQLYDINLLMYVILHELAHMSNYNLQGYPIHGHGIEFKQIFRILVLEAVEIGVYNYTNYTMKPQEYCGIIINSSII